MDAAKYPSHLLSRSAIGYRQAPFIAHRHAIQRIAMHGCLIQGRSDILDFLYDPQAANRVIAMINQIPNELLSQIIGQLPKSDGKVVRLVSRRWSALASKSVFRRVYIGPWDEHLVALDAIANHPVLGKAVLELVFDAREYEQGLTQYRYLQLLLWQMRAQIEANPDITPPSDTSHRIVFEHAREPLPLHSADLERMEKDFLDLPFVRDGFKRYSEQAKEQQRWLQKQEALKPLGRLFRMMSGVRHATFNSSGIAYNSSIQEWKDTDVMTVKTHLAPGLHGTKSFAVQLFAFTRGLVGSASSVQKFRLLLDNPLGIDGMQDSKDVIRSVLESAQSLSIEVGPHFTQKDVSTLMECISPLSKLECLNLSSLHYMDLSDTLYWSVLKFFQLTVGTWTQLQELFLSELVVDSEMLIEFCRNHQRVKSVLLQNIKLIGRDRIAVHNDIISIAYCESSRGAIGAEEERGEDLITGRISILK